MIEVGVVAALSLFAAGPAEPVFTEAALKELVACVDAGEGLNACPGLEAEAAVAAECLSRAPEADRNQAKLCLAQPVVVCMEEAAPVDDASLVLAAKICAARARGGVQLALADWLTAQEARLPAETVANMRGKLPEARRQSQAQAAAALAAGHNATTAAGVELGVWASFCHMLRTTAAQQG